MFSLHHPGCFCCQCPGSHAGAVTFVVGALDGDPVKLNLLKNYVSRALYNLVSSFRGSSFNVIHFSEEINKWCDRMVTWTPQTAHQAIAWIRTLACDSGAEPTEALAAAFEDPSCQTVYLVMDALPPRVLQKIYDFLARDENTCSVNVVYLLEEPHGSKREGSFRTINLKPVGSSNKTRINSCQRASQYCPSSSSSSCTFSTVVFSEPQLGPTNCCVHPKESPFSSSPVHLAPEALSLLRGARVLARRGTDGLYYMGHIAREVEGFSDRFLVEFEKCQSLKGKSQFRMQETPVCDIIHYEDARWRPLFPGDHVLAPADDKMEQYGPGTVLQGTETRARGLVFDSTGVLVTFWNGRTNQVPPGLAIWIPQILCDRITLELYIPPETHKKLIESCTNLPFMGTSNKHQDYQTEMKYGGPESHMCLYCGPNTGVCQKCHVPEDLWVALRNSLNHISQITSTKKKSFKKVDKASRKDFQLDPVKEKSKSQKRSIQNHGSHQISRHKEPLVYSRDTQTEILNIPETSYNKISNGGTLGSAYKPSTTSLRNRNHLQETLQRIEKAMKEDRKAMESVILERRPRSVPLKLNYEAKVRRTQELREQKELVTAELQRMGVEEKHKRREEKIQELEQRELMLQDNRRLRSQQRILLDLERRQDQEGLEAQKAESRRAAAEERNCKQDEDLRKEKRKEDQKIHFWRDLRKQRENLYEEEIHKQQEKEEKHKELLHNQMITRQQEADLPDRRGNQQLQIESKPRVSKRLEQFYQQAKQQSQKDKDLQQYLKEHNLKALRSAMVL